MRWTELAKKILALAQVVHRWLGALSKLEPERRARVARYAEAIADTLARAADALAELECSATTDPRARRAAIRELGRVHGYVATIVEVLQHRLDGRRLAGVKRRLECLDRGSLHELSEDHPTSGKLRVDHLYAAEGYFRALSDSLRV
jgi:acyl-CoA reductase-like NAD-dependent aldehyde dehydrogenase